MVSFYRSYDCWKTQSFRSSWCQPRVSKVQASGMQAHVGSFLFRGAPAYVQSMHVAHTDLKANYERGEC